MNQIIISLAVLVAAGFNTGCGTCLSLLWGETPPQIIRPVPGDGRIELPPPNPGLAQQATTHCPGGDETGFCIPRLDKKFENRLVCPSRDGGALTVSGFGSIARRPDGPEACVVVGKVAGYQGSANKLFIRSFEHGDTAELTSYRVSNGRTIRDRTCTYSMKGEHVRSLDADLPDSCN